MDDYQSFIHKSRYARWLPEEGRREEWPETIDRYFNFFEKHLREKHGYVEEPEVVDWLKKKVLNLEVMPSMRCLMTAGPALERSNIAAFNCSYLVIDKPESFHNLMLILLNGTGVGYSVERQYVNKFPEVPATLTDANWKIVVEDSKEGWATSLLILLNALYQGQVPQWDLSKIRPAGARLHTFGGRASGPGPLDELFRFVVDAFKKAKGRKLTSIECHDIACKVGEVVVVGGTRRSAMISLSNLSDERMRHAKSGQWWEHAGHRSLANNSVAYTEKPDVGVFMQEWLSLYESKSGERGIFNREASKKVVASNGRRDPNHEWGTNPCSEIILRPEQFCNLSEVVVRVDDTYESLAEKVEAATILGTWQSTLTEFPQLFGDWEKNTSEERLLGVSLTGILDNKFMGDPDNKALPTRLSDLRKHAVEINKYYAAKLGIEQSTAVTAVKPSGTVSQLVNSASGIHTRHSDYYIRTVRGDNKDPLTQFMKDMGIPNEPCVMRPESTTVFSFPVKAPDGATTRDHLDAVQHFKLWLLYQEHWCEHKPSVTINVREHEWPMIGAMVWEHFDKVSGVSFLPHDGGSYRQAPYQEVTKEVYEEALSKMPSNIDWSNLRNYEVDDNTTGTQEFACTAGVCEVVDLTAR